MDHHAAADCGSSAVGVHFDVEKTVLFGVRMVAMRVRLRRVIGG